MSGNNGNSNGQAQPPEPPEGVTQGPSILQQELAAAEKLIAEREAEAKRLAEEAQQKKDEKG